MTINKGFALLFILSNLALVNLLSAQTKEELIEKIIGVYQNLDRYQDYVDVEEFVTNPAGKETYSATSTKTIFVKEEFYEFYYYSAEEDPDFDTEISVKKKKQDPTALFSLSIGDSIIEKMELPLNMAVARVTSTSKGTINLIYPLLHWSKSGFSSFLANRLYLEKLEDANLDSLSYYRLKQQIPTQLTENFMKMMRTMTDSLLEKENLPAIEIPSIKKNESIYWFDKKTFLLVKVEELKVIGDYLYKTEITLHPKIE